MHTTQCLTVNAIFQFEKDSGPGETSFFRLQTRISKMCKSRYHVPPLVFGSTVISPALARALACTRLATLYECDYNTHSTGTRYFRGRSGHLPKVCVCVTLPHPVRRQMGVTVTSDRSQSANTY
jgi:hypothetical protein